MISPLRSSISTPGLAPGQGQDTAPSTSAQDAGKQFVGSVRELFGHKSAR